MKQYLIQMIDRGGVIMDARIYYSESAFRAAVAYEWPEEYEIRCYDVTDPLHPVQV